MLNSVAFVGRLPRDAELKYTEAGKPITEFVLTVERNYKNTETTTRDVDIINVYVQGKMAKTSAELEGGSIVAVKGQLHITQMENKFGKRYKDVWVNADFVRFLETKKIEVNPQWRFGMIYEESQKFDAKPENRDEYNESNEFPFS